ncbi:glycosyltransferase 87 family protein [Cryptosporangium arvum]|uniref:glycosyltransferase 87 family protein n=1 Tax=Cryptosporangium arvum TaxID=80871 RepID=UPI0012ECD2AB|nr:glycosyltransferase 87 family protein [Cryptosporangium arvum]
MLLVTTALAVSGAPLGPDLAAARALSRGDGPAALVTQLGSGAVLYPVLVLVAFGRRAGGASWRSAVLPIVILAAAQTLEAVTFVTLARPGPGGGTVSFSSGHAMAAVLGWGLLAREFRRRVGYLLVAIVALVVGLSRVALEVHWLSDVVAGWAFGVLALVVSRWVVVPDVAPSPRLTSSRWAWALPAFAVSVPVVPLFTVPGDDRMKDLLVYYGAGSFAGTGSDVYEFRTVFDMPFTYPPFAALLSEPLSRVPLGLLQVLWAVASLAALVGVARIGMRPVVERIGLPVTLAVLLVSAPVRSHLRFGQVGLFLVLLVAADLLRAHRRRGGGLGVAIAVKLTPAVYGPWLLVTRQWRAFCWAVGVSVAATVAGLLLLWPSAEEYLWRALWDSDRFGANDVVGNQSVRGMLLRSGLPEVPLLWLASALVLVVIGTYGAWRLELSGNRLGAVGVLAALSVAVSPTSWVHHLVWFVLPLAALVAARRYWLSLAWAVVLTVSLPSIGASGLRAGTAHPAFWHLVIDAQGLTAVATVLFLPLLVRSRSDRELEPAVPGRGEVRRSAAVSERRSPR